MGDGSSRLCGGLAPPPHGRAHLPHRWHWLRSAASAQAQLIRWNRDPMGRHRLGQAIPPSARASPFCTPAVARSTWGGDGNPWRASQCFGRSKTATPSCARCCWTSLLEVIHSGMRAQRSVEHAAASAVCDWPPRRSWAVAGCHAGSGAGPQQQVSTGRPARRRRPSRSPMRWLLVARRGQLLESCPAGAMVAVQTTEATAAFFAALAPHAIRSASA